MIIQQWSTVTHSTNSRPIWLDTNWSTLPEPTAPTHLPLHILSLSPPLFTVTGYPAASDHSGMWRILLQCGTLGATDPRGAIQGTWRAPGCLAGGRKRGGKAHRRNCRRTILDCTDLCLYCPPSLPLSSPFFLFLPLSLSFFLFLSPTQRLTLPSSCPSQFASLMRKCWAAEPKVGW